MNLAWMVFSPFVAAIAVPFLYKGIREKIHMGWILFWIPLFLFAGFLQFVPRVAGGSVVSFSLPWIPSIHMNLSFYLDGLSLLFALLITGIGTLVIFYSIYYMEKEKEDLRRFYVYLFLFMGAMLGVVLSDHVLILYGFWEMTSISSFLLIAYWYERKASRSGARKALMITVFGGLGLLAGLLLMVLLTDTYSIREMIAKSAEIRGSRFLTPVMCFLLLGIFTKSAQFPFGIWLPGAMEAPTPISAYLHSATMVKVGIYLVGRLTPIFSGNAIWFWTVTITGLITLLYGSIRAVRQTDLKALLAYSTISQLGLLMSLFGMGSAARPEGAGGSLSLSALAVFAGVVHLFNHSAFKGSLFMAVGIVDHETGTRDIRRLGGLLKIMPATFVISLIGSLSMAGLPPFSGFLSKEMFFQSVYEAMNYFSLPGMESLGFLLPVFAVAGSIFTFIYSMIFLTRTFFGEPHPALMPKEKAHEARGGMLVPPLVLAVFSIAGFLFPNWLTGRLFLPAVRTILPYDGVRSLHLSVERWHGWDNPALMMTGIVLCVGLLLFLFIRRWHVVWKVVPPRWSLNSLYERCALLLEGGARRVTDRYMTGALRHYLAYILLFFVTASGFFLMKSGPVFLDVSRDAPISIYDAGLVLGMVIAALTLLFTNNRLTAILALSAVGYLVVMLFVVLRAPDLALTQMVVETVTTVLFLLCFYHLPKMGKLMKSLSFKWVNAAISIAVGLTVTLFALAVKNHRLFEPITRFYEKADDLAGGKNIVNAIIVDFRGFDTMLEISVLIMAGLGVFTLIHLRGKDGKTDETE